MTIKVEREALIRVLERPPSNVSTSSSGDCLLVDCCSLLPSGDEGVGKLRQRAGADDEDSVYTLSTASFSDTDSEDAGLERRVSFSEELVTEEWTRPYTPKEDLPLLFYTTEETQRFRQEYRMERKLLSDLSLDPSSFPAEESEELSALISTSCCQPPGRHSISRVVVLHNDKLETFTTPPPAISQDSGDAFFDNDSFWSGSITWY